jgi:lipopolysaccharide transport system ATP-binding protein
VRYENRGASINDVGLCTVDGASVNVLSTRGRYVWRYSVSVEQSLSKVRFGMLIKTVSGLTPRLMKFDSTDKLRRIQGF